MSALLLTSAASDTSSRGSHASTHARRSSNSGPPVLSDTAAFALKSFLLDEEIRLQQQRLQHMLLLREQELQKQGNAHLEQELEYKHLILQQRFLTLTGEQQQKRQVFTPGPFQLSRCTAGKPPSLSVATSDDDASLCIEREHPHVLQRTAEQLSVSQLQSVDSSNVDCSASLIVDDAPCLPQQPSLQPQAYSHPGLQQSELKADSLQEPLSRQHNIQEPPLQQPDTEQPVLHQRETEQREREHLLVSHRQSPEQRGLRQQPVQDQMDLRQSRLEAAAPKWRGQLAAALQAPSDHLVITDYEADVSGEKSASARLVNVLSPGRREMLQAGAVFRTASPRSARRTCEKKVCTNHEARNDLHVSSVRLQGDSNTSQNASTVGGGPTAVGTANPDVPLRMRGLEDEASSVTTSSRDASSVDPRASASTRSSAGLDHAPGIVATHKLQGQHQEQLPSEACSTTCGDRAARYCGHTDLSLHEGSYGMEHLVSGFSGGERTPSETVRVAQSAGPPAAEETTPCLQSQVQDAQTDFTESSHIQSGGALRPMDMPAIVPTAPVIEARQPDAQSGGNAQADRQGGDIAAVGASAEGDSLQKGNTSFAKLDLSLAVSQQLRTSHIARGTELAIEEEVEEMLQKGTTQKSSSLSQERKHACGSSEDEEKNRLARTSGERGGEGISGEESSACESSDVRAPTFSNGVRDRGNRDEHEGSNAEQLLRLAEKLREQEMEKRLMQEESFQLEQMLKRQYFRDIQRKEAEKDELQQQLTHVQQLGNSLRQRLTDVTEQKNKLYDIVMLAQDALAEAVTSTPWSPRRIPSSRGRRASPGNLGRTAAGAAFPAGRAAVAETGRIAAPEHGAEDVKDADHSREAEGCVFSEEEQEEEALRKLLASREEVSQTLMTLVNKLKCAVQVLDTQELAGDDLSALSAWLRRAVVASNEEGEVADVSAPSRHKDDSPQRTGDLLSDNSNTSSLRGQEAILSDEEKDGETAQQLRQLQEEVNVLRKNLRSFTDAVLATQKQHLVKKAEGSATQRTPGKGHKSAPASVESGEVLPPQKLMLQRLEELQMLNAKLLRDNVELHRLCTQQVARSPLASASNSSHPRGMAYVTSPAQVAVAKQTATAGLHPVGGSALSQSASYISKNTAQCNFSREDKAPLLRSEVASLQAVREVAASFSPVSAASPATSASVAAHRIPQCVALPSPLICHTPATFLSYSGGAHNFSGTKVAGSTAGTPAAVEAVGGGIGFSYPAVHTKPPLFTEGGRTVPAVDAAEMCAPGDSRRMSPQVLPALRRELWRSPGLVTPKVGLESTPPYKVQEHLSMQGHLRHEDPPYAQGRSTPDQARFREKKVHPGDVTHQTYLQQASPERGAPTLQQPLLFQTNGEQHSPRVAHYVDTGVSFLPPRAGAAENATGPGACFVQHVELQRMYSQRGRHGGTAFSAAYGLAPAVSERSFPRLPQYSKSGRPQGSQQGKASRPAITPSSSASRLPLLRSFACGSSPAQPQRSRVRSLSSVGSGTHRKLPVTQSLTLLRQGNTATQSQRKLYLRSHSQLFTTEAGNLCQEASAAPAALCRAASPPSTENCTRIDLTVWGQRVAQEKKTPNRSAADSAAAAGRTTGTSTGGGRQATDGTPAKVFLRTRRASAVASADYFPALTPTQSDSRLLAPTEDRRRRQHRGSCALGRCWLGFRATGDKTSEATHNAPEASTPQLRRSHAYNCIQPDAPKYVQPLLSKTQEAARFQPFSPVISIGGFTKDHVSSPGSGLPARSSTEGVQLRANPTVPLSPTGGAIDIQSNCPFTAKSSPAMIPVHNSGMDYAHYHTSTLSAPAVGVPLISTFPYSQGSVPVSQPSCAAAAVSPAAGLHLSSVSLPPPPSAMSPALRSISPMLYDKGRASNFCRESVAPQPRFITGWTGEAPKVPDKIPAAQELWQTGGMAQQHSRDKLEGVGRTQQCAPQAHWYTAQSSHPENGSGVRGNQFVL